MSLPQNPDPAIQRAVDLLNSGHVAQAIEILHPICHAQNEDPNHWSLLGYAYGMSGNPDAAELALKKAISLNPGHARSLSMLGRLLVDRGRAEEGIAHLSHLLDLNPGNRQARLGIIRALMQLHRYAEAERLCEDMYQSEPGSVDLMNRLGIIYMQQGRTQDAMALFRRVLEANPTSLPAMMNIGIGLKSIGQLDAAIGQFDHVISVFPETDEAWYMLGICWLAKADMKRAAACLDKAFDLNPRNIKAADQLASVYRHMCKTEEAAATYKRILDVDPKNANAAFFLNAFSSHPDHKPVRRIPADMVRASYSGRNVGSKFDTSLMEKLEYRAPAVLDEKVRELCRIPAEGLDILEIGCGTGLCGSRFADIARTLVGTDLSADMLEEARKKNTYHKLYAADLVDVLSEYTSSFDLVIAMDVLCYFGDLSEIFINCHKTLRKGGVFGFSICSPDTDELWKLHPYGHFVHSLEYLREVAGKTGFDELWEQKMVLRREMDEDRVGFVCLFRRG